MTIRRSVVLLLALGVALAAAVIAGCGTKDISDHSPWQRLTGARAYRTGLPASIYFENARHGWRISFSYSGLWETIDGGHHWRRSEGRILTAQEKPDGLPGRIGRLLEPLKVVQADGALYVPFNGRTPGLPEEMPKVRRGGVLTSRDGGKTWRRCLTLPTREEWLLDFSAPGGKTLYALCGQRDLFMGTGEEGPTYLLRSSNEGRSWERVWAGRKVGTFNLIQPMVFVDALHGWSQYDVTQDGRAYTMGIRTTSDGGRTWQDANLEGGAGCFFALDASHAWAASGSFMDWGAVQTSFVATSDAGKTWQAVSALGDQWIGGIFFADAQRGWVHGGGAILATTDGGKSWVKEAETAEYEDEGWTFCLTADRLFATSGDLLYVRKLP